MATFSLILLYFVLMFFLSALPEGRTLLLIVEWLHQFFPTGVRALCVHIVYIATFGTFSFQRSPFVYHTVLFLSVLNTGHWVFFSTLMATILKLLSNSASRTPINIEFYSKLEYNATTSPDSTIKLSFSLALLFIISCPPLSYYGAGFSRFPYFENMRLVICDVL